MYHDHSNWNNDMRRLCEVLFVTLLAFSLSCSDHKKTFTQSPADKMDGKAATPSEPLVEIERIAEKARAESVKIRQQILRKYIQKEEGWPGGAWGDTMWCLSALYLNEKKEIANQRLLTRAQDYISRCAAKPSIEIFRPEQKEKPPWAYFGLSDYIRILHFFHQKSTHYPKRLMPDTESAMKEALWILVKNISKVADASSDNLLTTLGTENHDLTIRPNCYLAAALLKDDPDFSKRPYEDGHTAEEHFAAYHNFFLQWARQRAMTGLFIEIGSDRYQKYSWPNLFNLHELSPDPSIRDSFGMLMDIALIEEAQVSIKGRRGGGRSRAQYGSNNFEIYKNVLYGTKEARVDCGHTKIIPTSSYHPPIAAILIRGGLFSIKEPFIIQNRVLGELAHPSEKIYTTDSALINYAYRTPNYLLGSTQQNPALAIFNPDIDKDVIKYSGISRQKRWSGMIFNDPTARHPVVPAHTRADDEMCAIYLEYENRKGGRPQHSSYSFQHENVLLIQRISANQPRRPLTMGSYNTGKINIRFHGKKLRKVEEGGWIFANNGNAYAAIKFLDCDYAWDESGELASPVTKNNQLQPSRVLLHAGDEYNSKSFEAFKENILSNILNVTAKSVQYQPHVDGPTLESFLYDPQNHKDFKLPLIHKKAIQLRPTWTYKSPYLNSDFGSDKITVSVGPIKEVYDFSLNKKFRIH
jgi:hypothetical protein